MMFDPVTAAQTMVADARSFYSFGWLLGTSGNLSVRRDEESFLITASGKDKGRLTEADFLVCDLSGSAAHGEELRRPSAETLVHSVIYQQLAQAGAVYHVHEPYAALCSDRDAQIGCTTFQNLEMIKGLDIWSDTAVSVPIIENHADIAALAEAIQGRIDPSVPGVNILRHGIYAWGETPFAAKRHVESLAYLYRFSWERSR